MLTAIILIPLLGALVVGLLPTTSAPLARPIALVVSFVPLVLTVLVWLRFEGGPLPEQIESLRWIPALGVGYKVGVDGISLPLVALTALLFPVSMAYPLDLLGRERMYYGIFLFLEAASFGVFLALDLFLFFIFWDLTLVGMYFVIAVWGHGDALRSALKFFIYTLTGSLAMLLGILGLYLATSPRSFDMVALIQNPALPGDGLRASLVFLGFAVAFLIKAPLVPFHTWLPPAHVDAPGPGSSVLAGILLKMGTYGFIRISLLMLPDAFRTYAFALAIVSVVSIVYGALVSLAQTNLKRLIAYTSVAHMGLVVLGIAAAGGVLAGDVEARRVALDGAVVGMVSHGLITAALFLISGSVYARAHVYEMTEFGGLLSRAPRLALLTIVAAFGSLGLPGLAQFVADISVFVGAFAIYPVLVIVSVVGLVVLAALFLRMLRMMFLGPLEDRWREFTDLGRVETAALVSLLVPVVVIGVIPGWLINVIDATAGAVVGRL
ncbi:MAG: complex I subunit 4 family protein [Thermoleophilia bacterium]